MNAGESISGAYTLPAAPASWWHRREQQLLDDARYPPLDCDVSGCEIFITCPSCGTANRHQRTDGRDRLSIGDVIAWRVPNCGCRPIYRLRVARLSRCRPKCLCSRLREQARRHAARGSR